MVENVTDYQNHLQCYSASIRWTLCSTNFAPFNIGGFLFQSKDFELHSTNMMEGGLKNAKD